MVMFSKKLPVRDFDNTIGELGKTKMNFALDGAQVHANSFMI